MLEIVERKPTGRPGPSIEDLETMARLHVVCNRNASRASREWRKYSHVQILFWWKKLRLEVNTHGKRTDYRGYKSPLEYYRAHPEKFKGKRREEVFDIDSGLHMALLRHHQIDEAIPENHGGEGGGRPPLDLSEIEKLVNLYYLVDGNLTKAAEISQHCCPTISKYWRQRGLKARGKGGPKNYYRARRAQ